MKRLHTTIRNFGGICTNSTRHVFAAGASMRGSTGNAAPAEIWARVVGPTNSPLIP